jgi:malate/lactate dehydrogenase
MYLRSPDRDRRRFIGYSRNDSTRFRMMLAQALGVKTSRLESTVIGEHGTSQVLLFSSVRVNGQPVTISEEVKQKIRQEVPGILRSYEELRTGRTAGWTSAEGLAAVVRAIVQNTGQTIPCSAVLSGEYGCRGLSMGVPAIIGRHGIQEVLEWDLTPDEREGLENSINTLQPAMRYVEEHPGTG